VSENVITKELCDEIAKNHMTYLNDELLGVDSYNPEVKDFLKENYFIVLIQFSYRPVTSRSNGRDCSRLAIQLRRGILVWIILC